MATVLDVIKGLNQAAANAYDGALDESGEALSIGLNREEGHPIIDSRLIDGFKVRFAGPKMIVTYQAETRVDELHPRNQFENEIEKKFGDIVKFLKKEYKVITKSSVTLTEDSDANILVQSTSRNHTWVEAHKQYAIGGFDEVESLRMGSERSAKRQDKDYHKQFLDFLDKESTKRPQNDKSKKNPETPEA
jgi:predicted molibdopterin-dependent oxidoreductase YjgC